MASVLIPLPSRDFDPTEAAVPWRLLRAQGHAVTFATPDGAEAQADPRMVTGQDLGLLAPLLRANTAGRDAYRELTAAPEFRKPLRYEAIVGRAYDGLLLPGGHAPGMRPYLESAQLQQLTADFFAAQKPVAAICHGVLIAARARFSSGRSVLYGRKTTALTKKMELTAWMLTRAYLGDYYRTYPVTVEDEVRAALKTGADFVTGPLPVRRDSIGRLDIGFIVRDGNYLSARWPGDAHRFGCEFDRMLPHGQSAAA